MYSPEVHVLVSGTCLPCFLQDINHHYLMVLVAKAAMTTPFPTSYSLFISSMSGKVFPLTGSSSVCIKNCPKGTLEIHWIAFHTSAFPADIEMTYESPGPVVSFMRCLLIL